MINRNTGPKKLLEINMEEPLPDDVGGCNRTIPALFGLTVFVGEPLIEQHGRD